jgi:hypothetical protein
MSRRASIRIGAALLGIACAGCNAPAAPAAATQPSQLAPAAAPASSPSAPISRGNVLVPERLQYLGAFRLPGESERPRTFDYGGSAMTFRPGGDPEGSGDGFAGSLFISGHDRLPYGELADGGQIAEVTIPAPVRSRQVEDLPMAEFIQEFTEVARGQFPGLDEIPRLGMLYLDDMLRGPLIHLSWGSHLQADPPVASHTWFDPQLTAGSVRSPWFIAGASQYSVNGYMMEIPQDWADEYAGGRRIAIGRFRDGGWSGMGPSLFAYRPWDAGGQPPAGGAQVDVVPLLLYQDSETSPDIVHSLAGYQHPDEWEGGAWITTADGAAAVLFAGTKGTGARYWYGWVHPDGPDLPCVAADLIGQMPVCRMADGSPCPDGDLIECDGHNDFRGWWSTRFDAQFLLYDPADLAAVAAGQMEAWQPQPYATVDIDEVLLMNPSGVETNMIGSGDQRRFRINDAAYDRQANRLYVLEQYADGARPVVHVWGIE